MLQIPADRPQHNPLLLCALIAVTALLLGTTVLHQNQAAQPDAARVQQN